MKKLIIGVIAFAILASGSGYYVHAQHVANEKAKQEEVKKEKAEKLAAKKKAEHERQKLIEDKTTEAEKLLEKAEKSHDKKDIEDTKTAIAAIPDGNEKLTKRLDELNKAIEKELQVAKENKAKEAEEKKQAELAAQETEEVAYGLVDQDGNGIDDTSEMNDDEKRAESVQLEAKANAYAHNRMEGAQGTPEEDERYGYYGGDDTSDESDGEVYYEEDDSATEEISTDTNTLTGFINVYGMTPAAYKMANEGMSVEEALTSTPDNMQTSGEIQTEYAMQQENADESDEYSLD
ncbi:MAG: hypothetical protein ACK5MW_09100 [Enterococcus sp.]